MLCLVIILRSNDTGLAVLTRDLVYSFQQYILEAHQVPAVIEDPGVRLSLTLWSTRGGFMKERGRKG